LGQIGKVVAWQFPFDGEPFDVAAVEVEALSKLPEMIAVV
jgi:hypothetical protein